MLYNFKLKKKKQKTLDRQKRVKQKMAVTVLIGPKSFF